MEGPVRLCGWYIFLGDWIDVEREVCFEANYHTVVMAGGLGGWCPCHRNFLGYVCVSFSVLYLYDDTLYRFLWPSSGEGIKTCWFYF